MSYFNPDKHVNDIFHRLIIAPLKNLYKYKSSGTISLSGGIPLDSILAIKEITVKLINDEVFTITNGVTLQNNYTRGSGLVELTNWIDKHIQSLHQPKYNCKSCITVGSTDAFAKTIELLKGDAILYDKYAYGTAFNASQSLNKLSIGVKTDNYGMIPQSLKEQTILARSYGLTVNYVYLVPVSQNPSGITMSLQRKTEIYEICRELDLLIIEDDAYFYLTFVNERGELPGLHGLEKSFLSLDTDGRVIRFDTVSKFIAPGMRLGWITGPPDFIDKFLLLQEMTCQFPSGVSQSILLGLFNQWGEEGLDLHLKNLQAHYKNLTDVTCNQLDEEFGDLIPHRIKYIKPSGGMFIWIDIIDGPKSSDVFQKLVANNVIVAAGNGFYLTSIVSPNQNDRELIKYIKSNEQELYIPFEKVIDPSSIRITFASSTPETMIEGVRRIAVAIRGLLNN